MREFFTSISVLLLAFVVSSCQTNSSKLSIKTFKSHQNYLEIHEHLKNLATNCWSKKTRDGFTDGLSGSFSPKDGVIVGHIRNLNTKTTEINVRKHHNEALLPSTLGILNFELNRSNQLRPFFFIKIQDTLDDTYKTSITVEEYKSNSPTLTNIVKRWLDGDNNC